MTEQIFSESAKIDDDPRIELAVERTELALERTHLAWIRTIITLIASGFAIDKLVEVVHQSRLASAKALIQQAHITGIVMTITGLALILIETIFYVKRSKELARRRNAKTNWFSIGIVLSVLIFLVGTALAYLTIASGD